MLINSGDADCSRGNAAGKSILDKRRIEKDWNKDDPMKDAHVPKLKMPKKDPFHIRKKSHESINPHPIIGLKSVLGKRIIEEDHKGPVESVHVPTLQKPVRPSAVRDFPPGCGRYASPVAPENYISLPQRCLMPPVSACGDYSSGFGKNVSSNTKKQRLLAAAPNFHTNGVKDSSKQLSKVNYHFSATAKFRANVETNSVKQENDTRNEGNIHQHASMIKKEASAGISTVKVEGLCSPSHNTNGNNKVAPYKVVATPKELCLKIVRTSHQLSQPKFVKNAPELGPSKTLTNAVPMVGERATRSKVRATLRSFQVVCRQFVQIEEARAKEPALAGKCLRVDMIASKILRDNNRYVNTGKQIVGAVPGVEVGDQFQYRIELCIVGLHRQVQAGIDFLKLGKVQVATSIVASGGYEDDLDSGDVLIYTGQGGNNYSGDKRQSKHQKLECGNLALKNSIDRKIPVRVIRGFKQKNTGNQGKKKSTVNVIYTYDGLYDVEKYWLDNGASGFSVFKFQLRRRPGQPELGLKTVQFLGKTKKYSIRLKDISGGKERKCIGAVNTIDQENGPPQFVYTTKVIYPSSCQPMPHKGCDCTDGCLDPSKCFCALKNGEELPFNYDGAIVLPKPIVYECGPSCSCPPTCHNRLSQHGIRYKLEVFKTDKRGWGVRSSNSIPSGSFICEYAGKLLSDTEAEKCVGNDEYLFDIGRHCNNTDQSLWSDLSSLMPGIKADAAGDTVDDVGFTIDAAKYGNVARFVNHSCSPNLYAQNVLYDHDDKRLPHIMLFAAENIPPMRELCYDYNYNVGKIVDGDLNIKKKLCYCGSSECIGRMY